MINRRRKASQPHQETAFDRNYNDETKRTGRSNLRRRQWCMIVGLSILLLYSLKRWNNTHFIYMEELEDKPVEKTNMGGGFRADAEDALNDQTYPQHAQGQTQQGRGQSPLLEILQTAGYSVDDTSDEQLQIKLGQLPALEWIDDKYGGAKPALFGLDTCQAFQSLPHAEEHFIAVAGTFNTGTNLMAQLLWENCYMPARTHVYGMQSRGVRWQVPYGKHTPVDNETHRRLHRAPNERDIPANNVLPIVTIRDPYFWMDSMCRHPYEMEWTRDETQCPKLAPTAEDPEMFRTMKSFPVRIKYDGKTMLHASILHHYNEFYGSYINASWPRLIVRYEDLIFRPRQVTEAACHCAGGKMMGDGRHESFHYVKESAKDNSAVHGRQKTGLLEAMLQYTRAPSNHNMTSADLEYAERVLDAHLLQLFHYKTISTN